jgi:ABC-type lipoprotein export system ATPase subunit
VPACAEWPLPCEPMAVRARARHPVGGEAAGAVAIEVRGLARQYRADGAPLVVLDGLDWSVAAGEFVAVTGRSGAGKTTLLSILGGLERPQVGEVRVGGIDISTLGANALARYRRATVGFVFQDFGLLGSLTALENVELALAFAAVRGSRRSRRARELLDAVGLADRARHRPAALSGGENQRVAIARALANHPRLVLADEPTGNLDDASATLVLDLLASLPAEHECTLIVVTHNHTVASRADRVVHLESGHLVGAA